MTDTPFVMFALFLGFSLGIGGLGVGMGLRKIDGAPIVCIIAGILMLVMLVNTAKVQTDYVQPVPSNTTETGGNVVCTTTTNTTCTVSSIQKVYSYIDNQTGKFTNSPSPIPYGFDLHQENLWVYYIAMAFVFFFIGIIFQVKST